MKHVTVLLHESIDNLAINPRDIIIDGTLGGGGHSEEILKRYRDDNLTMIGIDLDQDALTRSKERLQPLLESTDTKMYFIQDSFRNLDKALALAHCDHVDKILLDLGLSSFQLEESGRGFSFKKDEPLIMSFDKEGKGNDSKLSVYDIVNSFEEEHIADIIYGYGEESFSRRIARAIVLRREVTPFKTTFDLADTIKESVPVWYRKGKIHPATKTFQALRIAVNDELGALREALSKGFNMLSSEGRMVIISFHSLEDRIVKVFFKELVKEEKAELISKKPITPSSLEVKENPRSRSAKLRIIKKLTT